MVIKRKSFDIYTVSAGSYPRIGSVRGQALRKLWNSYGEKKINNRVVPQEIRVAENSMAEEILKEQISSGLDIITDGLVRWYCPISHIAGRMEGVLIGALHHFGDTNFHVRKAVVEDLPEWKVPLLADEIRFARSVTDKPMKAVLTGPATFCRHMENRSQKLPRAITGAYVEALCHEITLLAAVKGVAIIQMDDPWLLHWPNEWDYFAGCYAVLYEALQRSNAHILLEVKIYGSKCSHMLSNLFELHCDYLGLDCVADPQAILRILQNPVLLRESGLGLSIGIVDARSSIMEDPYMLERIIEPLLLYMERPLLLESSCGLEFLPRRFAKEKCRILSETKRLLVKSALYKDTVKMYERRKETGNE
ncbi:MAG: hypothetical protein HYT37_04525 [Candidatus Sungbacteria bacterium]|nr:hypothetical protein [Candidatus Sungbacteria bacterium]